MSMPPAVPEHPRSSGGRPGARVGIAWVVAFAVPLLVLAACIADTFFLCDDAFISFRYARNLIEGNGLVFNRDEYVEGYTNLLWTLEVAGLWLLGVRPEVSAHLLSLGATVGTLGAMVWAIRGLVPAGDRRLVAWLAISLVACCPSFAVWSTGGLETRQFTFLVVLGAAIVMRRSDSVLAMLLASVVFAAAELTRPEGLLLFCCTFAWVVVAARLRGGSVRPALAFAVPFVCLVGAQFAWRHHYYGEWLPNTYYAKHVRAWYESGFDYLAAAAVELGAWLWVPLAFATAAARAAQRDLAWMLTFVLVLPHAGYLLNIGGDHFEYRPLDFYLPLLSIPAAVCLLGVVRGATELLPAAVETRRRIVPVAVFVAGALVCVYSHAIGVSTRLASRHLVTRHETFGLRVILDAENAPALQWLPGGAALTNVIDHLRARLAPGVAVPSQEHIVFGRTRVTAFAVCEELPRGAFSSDAVTAEECIGILPFYLPDLTVIDTLGLTDAAIARTPVDRPNSERQMAHDRRPPRGYLDERGVNLKVLPVVPTVEAALAAADYALELTADAWLPIVALDRLRAQQSLATERLAWRFLIDPDDPAANRVLCAGDEFQGARLLATFDGDGDELQWQLSGSATRMTNGLARLFGLGEGALLVGQGKDGDARSSEFVAQEDDVLVVFLAGRAALGQKVRLLADDVAVESLMPAGGLDLALTSTATALRDHAGKRLRVEVSCAGDGFLAVDHLMLARRVDSSLGARSLAWARGGAAGASPLAGAVEIEPLRADGRVAASGETWITLDNPFEQPIEASVSLVSGPGLATLECGPWSVDGEVLVAVEPGRSARAPLAFDVADGVRVDLQPFVVRVEVSGASIDPGAGQLDLELPWKTGR